MPDRTSLFDLTRPQLTELVLSLGAPRYRADQLWQWLYHHLADSFDVMTNLPAAFRAELAERATLHTLAPILSTDSDDGLARKVLFRLHDGQLIETVLMHYLDPADEDDAEVAVESGELVETGDLVEETSAAATPRGRHTVCFSTQVGCAMGCVFCATGQMGLVRDLTLGECVEQLVWCARLLRRSGERLTNVVFMGMGEPLANWDATWNTVLALSDPDGFGLSPRRLTISTVGLVPGIRRLAEMNVPVRLAVSIHAPNDALRDQLVPINRTYPLDDVLAACRDYQLAGGRRITFEYVLIAGVNDAVGHAREFARQLRGLRGHVNLIPLNPTAGSPMQPSSYADAVAFENVLRAQGVPTTLRMRRGIEIQAGCGQLRSRVTEGRMGRTIPLAAQATA